MGTYVYNVFVCSLCKLVQHVGNPADCSSVERCILAYLVELFTTSADVKEKYSQLFSGAESKVKSALCKMLSHTVANHMWDRHVLIEVLDNPKKALQYDANEFLKSKYVFKRFWTGQYLGEFLTR